MNNAAESAAKLTDEQKEKLPKIAKKYLITITVFAIITTLVFGVLFYYFQSRSIELADNSENALSFSTVFDSDYSQRFEQSEELMNDSHKAANRAKVVLIGYLCFFAIGMTVIIVLFKKKYPYYSDKVYRYVKNQNSMQQKSP